VLAGSARKAKGGEPKRLPCQKEFALGERVLEPEDGAGRAGKRSTVSGGGGGFRNSDWLYLVNSRNSLYHSAGKMGSSAQK